MCIRDSIEANQSEPSAIFNYNGAVKLYYDGGTYSTPKLETTATGITLDGEVAASQDYPNFRPTLDLNFAAVKKLDSRITYQRTGPASYVDKFGLVRLVGSNEPRFDHDPVTRESKGLLIEESRTNLIKWSLKLGDGAAFDNDISNQGWGTNNVTSTIAESVVAPDGKTGGVWEVRENNANSYHAIWHQAQIPLTNGTKYFITSWVKKGANYNTSANTNGYFQFYCSRGTGSVASVTLNNTFTAFQAHTNTDSRSITQYRNGWIKVMYSFTANATNTGTATPHWLHGGGGSYAGNGASSVYIWGCQMEAGAFETSHILTNGSTVTRGLDLTTVEGTDFSDAFGTDFNEFSLVADYDNTQTVDGTAYGIIDLWGESTGYDDRVEWFKDNASPYHIETRSFGQGNATFVNGNLSASSKAKSQRFATSWYVPDYSNTSSRRFVVSMGGEAVDVIGDNSGTTVPQLTRMGIGCNPTRLDFSGGVLHFKRLMLYNRTLSDGQLQNLSAQ